MFARTAVGIELGDGALKAVTVERRGHRTFVTSAEYRKYARPEDGAARPDAGLDPRAFAALTQFLAEQRPSPLARVYIGMPSIAAFNKLVRVPNLAPEQLRAIADYELHRSVRGSLEDYVVQTRVVPSSKETLGGDVPCMLFAIRRKLRDAFVSDLSRAGLEFDMLVPSPVAVAQFARYDRPAKGDRILVSIGLRSTEVIYERGDAYCFRTLPLGCVALTTMADDTPEEQSLRRKAARRLVKKLTYEIGAGSAFFFADGERWDPQSVSLFGEGAIEPEIAKQFERAYQGKVEAIGKLHRIAVGGGVKPDARRHLGQMASALGLALQAARADIAEIELVPPHLGRSALRRLPALAIVSVILAALCFGLTWRDLAAARDVESLTAPDYTAQWNERRTLAAKTFTAFDSIARADDSLAMLLEGRARRAEALARIVPQFGPNNATYGPVDVRLRQLTIDRTPAGTAVHGVAKLQQGDLGRSLQVLGQRLHSADGLATPAVRSQPAADASLPEVVFDIAIGVH